MILQWRQGRIRQQALQNCPIKRHLTYKQNIHGVPRCQWVHNLSLPIPPLPSHFSADFRESQDRVLGRLALPPCGDANGGGVGSRFTPPPPPRWDMLPRPRDVLRALNGSKIKMSLRPGSALDPAGELTAPPSLKLEGPLGFDMFLRERGWQRNKDVHSARLKSCFKVLPQLLIFS